MYSLKEAVMPLKHFFIRKKLFGTQFSECNDLSTIVSYSDGLRVRLVTQRPIILTDVFQTFPHPF